MRNPHVWLELAAILGPVVLGGILFVPIALVIFGVVQQLRRKESGIAPMAIVAVIAALLVGFFTYPNHFATIEACQQLDSELGTELSMNRIREALGLPPTDTTQIRLEMVQRGCSSLPGYSPVNI